MYPTAEQAMATAMCGAKEGDEVAQHEVTCTAGTPEFLRHEAPLGDCTCKVIVYRYTATGWTGSRLE